MDTVNQNIKEITTLCQTYKVAKLFAFGSVLTDNFTEQSDVDLIVDFNKNQIEDYFNNYFDFKYALEAVFGRKVDLVEEQAIKNPYFKKTVDATKTLIYG